MGIRDRPIAARSPWQNGHVERLIGSIRRECMDHTVVFKNGAFSSSYNQTAQCRSGFRIIFAV
jgi:transposase InsO family protein